MKSAGKAATGLPEFVPGTKHPGAAWPVCERPRHLAVTRPGCEQASTAPTRPSRQGRDALVLRQTLTALLRYGPATSTTLATREMVDRRTMYDRLRTLAAKGMATADRLGVWRAT